MGISNLKFFLNINFLTINKLYHDYLICNYDI